MSEKLACYHAPMPCLLDPKPANSCGTCIRKALATQRRVESGELKLFDPGAFLKAVSDGEGVKDAMALALDEGKKNGGSK